MENGKILETLNIFIMRDRADYLYRFTALENLVMDIMVKVCGKEEFGSLIRTYRDELHEVLQESKDHYDGMLKIIDDKYKEAENKV